MTGTPPRKKRSQLSWADRHPLLVGLLIAFAVLLFCDLFFGTINNYYQRTLTADDAHFRYLSPIYHHGLVPFKHYENARWGRQRYTMNTNSLGFKDRKTRQLELTTERHRVLFVGDSFTEGLGFPYEKTFVGIITEELATSGVEVLNGAVSSYSPSIYYAKTRHLLEDVGFEFDELIVFLDISDPYNEATAYQMTEKGIVRDRQPLPGVQEKEETASAGLLWWARDTKRRIKEGFLNHTIILKTVRMLLGRRQQEQSTDWREKGSWTLDQQELDVFGYQGLEIMRVRMGRLLKLLADHDITMTVAVYPWPYQILQRDLDSIHVQYWRKWAQEHRVKFIDFFPSFINGADPEQVVGRYFIPGDVHWNEDGHQLIAEKFLRQYHAITPSAGNGSTP